MVRARVNRAAARIGRRFALLGAIAVAPIAACSGAPSHPPRAANGLEADAPSASSSSPPGPAGSAAASFAGRWGTYHSRRFELSFALPDGKAWRIDDHRTPWLLATHEATGSRLVVRAWSELGVPTEKACYQKARSWDPSLPELEGAPALVDQVRKLKSGLEARLVIAATIGPDEPAPRREGAAPAASERAAGGFLALAAAPGRKCVVFVYRTGEARPGGREAVLDRLAEIENGTLESFALDEAFTVPREAPSSSPIPPPPAAASQ